MVAPGWQVYLSGGRVLSKEDVARGERFSRKDDDSLEKAALGRNEQAVSQALARAARKTG